MPSRCPATKSIVPLLLLVGAGLVQLLITST
jgi:hypothetical protein